MGGRPGCRCSAPTDTSPARSGILQYCPEPQPGVFRFVWRTRRRFVPSWPQQSHLSLCLLRLLLAFYSRGHLFSRRCSRCPWDSFSHYGALINVDDKTSPSRRAASGTGRQTSPSARCQDQLILDGDMDSRKIHMHLQLADRSKFLCSHRTFPEEFARFMPDSRSSVFFIDVIRAWDAVLLRLIPGNV